MTRSQKITLFMTVFAASALVGYSVSNSSQVMLPEASVATTGATVADCPSEDLIGYADVPRGWNGGVQGHSGLVLELVCMAPDFRAPAP